MIAANASDQPSIPRQARTRPPRCSTAASRRWTSWPRAVGLSPSHLQRSFTARFGLSPAAVPRATQARHAEVARCATASDVSARAVRRRLRLAFARVRRRRGEARHDARRATAPAARASTSAGAWSTPRSARRWSRPPNAASAWSNSATMPRALEAKLRARIPAGARWSASTPAATNSSRRACAPSPTRCAGKQAHGRHRPDRHRVPEEGLGCADEDPARRDPQLRRSSPRSSAHRRARARSPVPARTTASRSSCPCHRVVRGDGSLGGYRWGLPLKEAAAAARTRGVTLRCEPSSLRFALSRARRPRRQMQARA